MSAAIDFAVRSSAGGTTNGTVGGDDQANFIQVGAGDSISLNVSKESVLGFQRVESDLVVELADGSTVVLLGWFNAPEGVVNHLYLSSDGQIAEVLLSNGTDGYMVADYGPVTHYDKWSPLDDLRFDSGDPVVASAGATNEPAGMGIFTPVLMGLGGGGVGAAALAGGALAGGAVLSGGGGSGGGGGNGGGGNGGGQGPLDIGTVAGDDMVNKAEQQQPVVIGGTSAANAVVTVTIPGVLQSTQVTANAQGQWSYSIPAGTLVDGTYTVTATSTDARGRVLTATETFVVDTVTQVSFDSTAGHSVLGDGYVNAAEARAAMTVTGKAEAGSTKVELEWNGVKYAATVDAAGNWSATLPAGAAGAVSGATVMTVTSTDRAGNTASAAMNVQVDLEAGVSVTSQPGGADGVLSGAERSAGFVLTGTADAGARVFVSYMGGQPRMVTADANGTWSLGYSANDLASGEVASGASGGRFSVYSIDAAGNQSATVVKDFAVDTVVRNFSFGTPDLVGAVNDGPLDAQKLNAAERADGLVVNGTVEPGSTVTVQVGNNSTTVQAAGGNWSFKIPAGWLPEGANTQAVIMVRAQDQYGNLSDWQQKTVAIDTSVTNFAKSDVGLGFGVDNVLNAVEAERGLPVSGKAEAGSSVTVSINGVSHTVLADGFGNWSTSFTRAELPSGEHAALPASVTAVDPNGNVARHDFTFAVDTVAPTSPVWVQDAGGGGALSGIFTAYSPDTFTYHSVAAQGAAVDITPANVFRTPVNVGGQVVDSEMALFSQNVPDGSYLVIRDVDAAGNESSTLYLRTTVATDVDLSRPGLANFDISTVDLSSTQGRLTITDAQLQAITGPDHKLVVRGGADDQVNLVGATALGQTHTDAAGQHYAVYTLNGATIFVDEDINRTVI